MNLFHVNLSIKIIPHFGCVGSIMVISIENGINKSVVFTFKVPNGQSAEQKES